MNKKKTELSEIAADFSDAMADLARPKVEDFDPEKYKSATDWSELLGCNARARLDKLITAGSWGRVQAMHPNKGNLYLYFKKG